MRWFEYKMEVDDLHASDDLKAKLLAMQGGQTASSAPKAAPKLRKAIRFSRKTLSIAACGLLGLPGLLHGQQLFFQVVRGMDVIDLHLVLIPPHLRSPPSASYVAVRGPAAAS